jgi:hypothetical protein
MKLMGRLWHLVERARERYRLEGARGLAAVGLSFLQRLLQTYTLIVHALLNHYIGVVTRETLREMGCTWTVDDPSTVKIPPADRCQPNSGDTDKDFSSDYGNPADTDDPSSNSSSDSRRLLDNGKSGDSLPDRLARHAGTYHRDAGFVTELHDVTLLGQKAIPVTDRGVVLDAFSSRQDRLEGYLLSERGDLWRLLRGGEMESDREFEAVCSFASVGSGYCEWVQSVLTRLQGLAHYTAETGIEPIILLPPDPPSWMVDSLEFLGYDDWMVWTGGTARVERFVVPSVRTGEYTGSHYAAKLGHDDPLRVVHPGACAWLRERALDGLDDCDGPDALYISRAGASRRQVHNREAVKTVLAEHGVVSRRMETLPFEKQIATMFDADLVVAPHGAGLVNTIFVSETTVVELFGANVKSTYFLLAGLLGHEYRHLMCESEGDDLVVDTGALDALLAECRRE